MVTSHVYDKGHNITYVNTGLTATKLPANSPVVFHHVQELQILYRSYEANKIIDKKVNRKITEKRRYILFRVDGHT